MIRLQRVSVLLCAPLLVYAALGQSSDVDDVRYLVIRRAGSPEKNYYELAKQVVMAYAAPSFLPGLMDVETKEPGGIRYRVHSIWKVRVLRVTDSQKESVSPKDGYYVLIYERDPDVRFCSMRYEVSSLTSGKRYIKYTDCADKKQYSLEMTKQRPRPFVIYEVEVTDREALRSVWQQQFTRK